MKKKSPDLALATPPHSEEAEMAVLASILADNKLFDRISELVSKDDFYHLVNGNIFSVMGELNAEGQAIDMITIKSKLESKGTKVDVTYLTRLGGYIGYAGVESHCKIIREKALRRNIIVAAHEAIELVCSEEENAEEILQSIEQRFFSMSKNEKKRETVPIKNLIGQAMDRFDYAKTHQGHVFGLETGLLALDKMTTGFNPPDYIILAGRPSMGKTSLALNIAYHVASKVGLPVLFFSLEMSREQIGERVLCMASKIDYHKMRQGYGSDEEWARISIKMGEVANTPLLVNDNAAMSLNFMRSQIRKAKIDYPELVLVVIDYIQLMSYPEAQSREEAVSELSKGVKAMCKDMGMPILVISQLNRQVEMRASQEPRLSDLRESGTLEQDADMVLFVWHEEGKKQGKANVSKIKIGKQRNGPVGTIDVLFFPESMRFENIGRE